MSELKLTLFHKNEMISDVYEILTYCLFMQFQFQLLYNHNIQKKIISAIAREVKEDKQLSVTSWIEIYKILKGKKKRRKKMIIHLFWTKKLNELCVVYQYDLGLLVLLWIWLLELSSVNTNITAVHLYRWFLESFLVC